jgi:hypothetical protein
VRRAGHRVQCVSSAACPTISMTTRGLTPSVSNIETQVCLRSGLAAPAGECAREVVRVDRRPDGRDEESVQVRPRVQRLRLLPVRASTVLPQSVGAQPGQRDTSATASSWAGQPNSSAPARYSSIRARKSLGVRNATATGSTAIRAAAIDMMPTARETAAGHAGWIPVARSTTEAPGQARFPSAGLRCNLAPGLRAQRASHGCASC